MRDLDASTTSHIIIRLAVIHTLAPVEVSPVINQEPDDQTGQPGTEGNVEMPLVPVLDTKKDTSNTLAELRVHDIV
jgi:hypothetical protein